MAAAAAYKDTMIGVKFNKTWVAIAAALLIIVASIVISIKLGIAAVALLILVRLIKGPSDSDTIIGLDHVSRPRSSSYGGGFSPGGLFGVSGLGSHFGAYGTSLADSSPEAYMRGSDLEHSSIDAQAALSKKQRSGLAAAIKEAEARTGHQILAVIGPLKEDHNEKADRVATKWPTASIVICIDPVRKLYELRWRDASFELDEAHLATFADMIRRMDLTAAVALLAEVLPVQTGSTELPDVIEE